MGIGEGNKIMPHAATTGQGEGRVQVGLLLGTSAMGAGEGNATCGQLGREGSK